MAQFIKGHVGFFDAGTAGPGLLSLWFRSNGSRDAGTVFHGTPIMWEQAKETTSPNVSTSPNALLPKHRTWSGGLLFTLPEAHL